MLKVGDKAPVFSLPDQDGIEVGLKDLLGQTLVLYFYPKDNTSGCSIEAQEFTQLVRDFEAFGVSIVGVSPDSPQSHKKFIANKELDIVLLSDADKSVSAIYGAYGKKMMYGKEVQGIIRSTFVISLDGTILQTFYNVRAKGHAQKVFEFIQSLK